MANTAKIDLTDTWVAVAEAGLVLLTTEDQGCRFAMSDDGAPAADLAGHSLLVRYTAEITVPTGATLYVRGAGTLHVTAEAAPT